MYTTKTRNMRRLAASFGLVTLTAVPAWAQGASTPGASGASAPAASEVMIVTAQKREQSINEVGIAVTAISGDTLARRGLTDTRDIAALVPSFKVLDFAPTTGIFNIRGVSQNDFGDQLEAPIAVFRDEAYVGAMGAIAGELFDIQRIEVERGPQGTLFGRNATGGVVQYISNAPTRKFEGYAQGGYGSENQYRFEGAVSGPIGERVSARVAAVYLNHDGWMKNSLGRDLSAADELGLRGRIRIEPSDALTVDLIGYYLQDFNVAIGGYTHSSTFADADGLAHVTPPTANPQGTCPGCDLAGYRNPYDTPYRIDAQAPSNFDRNYFGGTAKVEYNTGVVTFTSITDLLRMRKVYFEDSDSGPTNLFNYGTDQRYVQVSEEGRITAVTGPATITAGAYYLNMKQDDSAFVDGDFFDVIISGLIGVPFTGASAAAFTLNTNSISGFGNIEYELGHDLALIGGVRYTHDTRELNYFFDDGFGGQTIFNTQVATSTSFPSVIDPALAKRNFNGLSAKAGLNWKLTDNILAYASYSRGFKSGNYETPVFPADLNALPHNPEKLDAYEVGAKISIANRAQVNTAVFYYDYTDYQAFAIVNAAQVLFNTDARLFGAELELQAEITPQLSLIGNVSTIHSKVFDVPLISGISVDSKLPQAAPYSGSVVLRYEAPVGPVVFSLEGGVDFSGPFNFSVFPSPALREPDYVTGNLSVGFRSADDRWRVLGTITNLWNERYRTSSIDTSFIGLGQETFARPRWFTVTLSTRF